MRKSFLVVVCALAAAAMGLVAAGQAAASPPLLNITLKGSHGYSVEVGDFSCGKGSSVSVSYFKTKGKATLTHSYFGQKSKCSATKSLSSASLSAKWGGLVNIKLRLHATGKEKSTKLAKGCTGKGPLVRKLAGTGTFDLAIKSGLGKTKLHKVKAELTSIRKFHCKSQTGPTHITGISLSSSFGSTFLNASQPVHGARSVFITSSQSLPAKVTGDTTVSVSGGSSLFDVPSNLGSAKIGSAAPVVTGSLTFHSDPMCAGSPNSRTGTFTGSLVVHDDVNGTQTLKGSGAAGAELSKNGAEPPSCSPGGGGGPPTPTPPSAGFSFQQDLVPPGNADLYAFTDQSFATSGSIKSYSWSFGDPASGASNSSTSQNPSHTFSATGSYTVKETVTDTNNLSNSSTQTVMVAPYPSPTASFSDGCNTTGLCSVSGGTNQVDFTDNSQFSSDGQAITQEAWDFGDGDQITVSGSGQDQFETYANPGTYTVTLTVTDAFGKTNTTTQSVFIDP